VKIVVQKFIHKLGGLLKIANHIKNNHQNKMINMSKDVKNTTYSKNDIHYTMKLIFGTSLFEVLHQP
jgi:hypothetical protein